MPNETRVCSICGRHLQEYDEMRTQDGLLCSQCFRQRRYQQCSVCGEYFTSEDNHRICPNCEEKVYQRDINSYGTKPYPYFKNFNSKLDGKDVGCRYYGMELEFNDSNPSKVHELGIDLYNEKFIYNKSDSSIGGGVEVVTSPMDRRVIPQFLKRMKPIFDYVGTHNYKHNAGLHVHVNKKTIDAIDRYKLNILLNNLTDPSLFCLQEKIAGFMESAKVKFSDGVEKEFLAKLDTGNSTTASVLEVGEYIEEGNKVKFNIDGKQMEFEKIKVSKAVAGEETYERPVIEIPELTIGLRKLKNVHIAIVKDRDKKTTNFLLNRDTMSKLGYVINPNTAHILTKEMQKVKII